MKPEFEKSAPELMANDPPVSLVKVCYQYTMHKAHCTLHTAHCTLHTAHILIVYPLARLTVPREVRRLVENST